MRLILFLLTGLILISCSSTKQKIQRHASSFKGQVIELVENMNNQADHTQTLFKSKQLLDAARPILKLYSKEKPNCQKFLTNLKTHIPKMLALDLGQIEIDYHRGDALDPAPDECFEAKELIVHPATVAILARHPYSKKNREKIIDEMEEVIEHLDILMENLDLQL